MKTRWFAEQERQDTRLMTGYLLGRLSDEEERQVEDRFFADPAFREQLEAVEGDLLNDYARGKLSPDEAAKLERNLLTSDYQRQKAEAAKALLRSIEQEKARKTLSSPDPKAERAPRWNLFPYFTGGAVRISKVTFATAAGIAILFASGWLIANTARLQRQLETLRSEQSILRQQQQKLAEQLANNPPRQPVDAQGPDRPQPREPRAQSDVVFGTLLPTLSRAGGASLRQFTITPEKEIIRLSLYYEREVYPTYQAILETYDGDQVLTKTGLRLTRLGGKKIVTVDLPARLLMSRTYVLKLRSDNAAATDQDLDRYSFTVRRK